MVSATFLSLGALSLSAVHALPGGSAQPRARLVSRGASTPGRITMPVVKLAAHSNGQNAAKDGWTSRVDVGAQWFIPAWIGTPGKQFYFLGDSGAPNLSIESTLEPKDHQGDIPLYDPSQSSTAKQLDGYTYSECFGSGYCDNGVVYTDIFTVGQIALEGMPIMVQTNNTSPTSGTIRSGNLGLNIDPNGMTTQPNRLPTYFQQIMPYLESPLWTVDYRTSTKSGQFEFGAIDSSRYHGTIAYGALSSTGGLWTTIIDGIGAGYDNSAFREHKFQVAWDTGSGGGQISREIADLYWSQVPNSEWRSDWDNYLYKCDQQLPDFVIRLSDGNKVGIPGSALFYKRATGNDEGKCLSMLAIGSDNDTLWGQDWIEKFFVIFDWGNKRVGVANKDQ